RMKKLSVLFSVAIPGIILCALASGAGRAGKDESDIRALEDRFAAAFKAKDLDGIMSVYVPDESLIVFDIVPPRQFVGAKAYRQDFEQFMAMSPGPIEVFEIKDLSIVTDHDLAFSHSIQHLAFTGKDGKEVDITVRVTDGYRKIKGKWLIVH